MKGFTKAHTQERNRTGYNTQLAVTVATIGALMIILF